MENGHDRELAEKLSGLAINDDSLIQIMKAVEAAEITIKQQAEESSRLRFELQKKVEQLEKYKVESGSNSNAPANEAAYTNFNGTLNALPPAYLPDDKLDSHLSLFSPPLSAISFSPTRMLPLKVWNKKKSFCCCANSLLTFLLRKHKYAMRRTLLKSAFPFCDWPLISSNRTSLMLHQKLSLIGKTS